MIMDAAASDEPLTIESNVPLQSATKPVRPHILATR